MKAPNGIWLLLRGVHFDMDKPMVLLSPLRLIRACIKQRDRARRAERYIAIVQKEIERGCLVAEFGCPYMPRWEEDEDDDEPRLSERD